MKKILDDNRPIFIQIKEMVEDSIIDGSFTRGTRVPSTNELAAFYQINPATAGKGINELVAEGILVKKRGVGMFVTDTAREIVKEKRKQTFYDHYILPLKREARILNLKHEDLLEMLEREDEDNEN
jgi:DNA-binding transcriptional regulator YhcF (GntR family)